MRGFVVAASVAAILAGVGYVEVSLPGAQFVKMPRVSFNCDTDAECAALPPCAQKAKAYERGRAVGGCDGSPYTEPFHLVGYDCVGAIEPLYRDEEDQFPRCGAIEPIWHGIDTQ